MPIKTPVAADIVKPSVLLNIAKRIRAKAAEIARSKNVPLRTANDIGIPAPKTTQKQIEVNLTINKKLAAFEWGSGLHGNNPRKYPITPKNKPALIFPGTNQFAGQLIVTDLVMHPGIKKKPFIEPAKRQTRRQNLDDLQKESTNNIRLIVRSMARKI
jgi:hypothetical protein